MYAVRTKGGRVVGRYATRVEAERACRLAKSPSNLPHGWQNWARFEEHDGRHQHDTVRFIEWAEPPPRDQSASRYAVVKHGNHIAWARVHPNPDVSTDYSSGGFYDDMPGGAVAAAKRAAMAHKEKIRGWTSRSPVRGAERTRLLKVHADVSKKLWAKSPSIKANELYRLANLEHERHYAAAKRIQDPVARQEAFRNADRIYNLQLEYQRKIRHGERSPTVDSSILLKKAERIMDGLQSVRIRAASPNAPPSARVALIKYAEKHLPMMQALAAEVPRSDDPGLAHYFEGYLTRLTRALNP